MPDHRIKTQLQLGSGENQTLPSEPHSARRNGLIFIFSIRDLIAPQASSPTSQLGIAQENGLLTDLPAHRIGSRKRWGGNGCRGWGQLNRHSQWHRFDGEQRPRQEHKGACNEGSDQGCQGRRVFGRHGVVIIET
jgi:hypothetical protein